MKKNRENKRRELWQGVWYSFLLMVVCSITHCGLFSPGDPETPDPTQVTVEDPLKLRKMINNNSGEHFSFQDYEYLFSNDFVYYDGNKPEEKFEKARTLNRVTIIEKDHIRINDRYKLYITWVQKEDDPAFERNKVVKLKPRVCTTYVISRIDTTITSDSLFNFDTTFVFKYVSEASFDLKFNPSRNEWAIIRWVETKFVGSGNKPFCHPNFILP